VANATARAASVIGVLPPFDTTRSIVIVFPGYEKRAELQRGVSTPDQAWMVDLLAQLRDESIEVTAAGRMVIDGRARLVLFALVEPGTVASAALIAAARGALSVAPPASELEPGTLSDATLARWERPAADVPAHPSRDETNGPSDARWLWIIVLVLLLAEMRVRRTMPPPVAANQTLDDARAA
jgi:hypothetical protein